MDEYTMQEMDDDRRQVEMGMEEMWVEHELEDLRCIEVAFETAAYLKWGQEECERMEYEDELRYLASQAEMEAVRQGRLF